MNNELTKEERDQVFHFYSNSEVIWRGHRYPVFHYFRGLLEDLRDETQLILAPISAITDEHAIEAAEIEGSDSHFRYRPNLKNLIQYVKTERIEEWVERSFKLYSWAIKNSYAVPLWFGIDHRANGKTAIELGIALDSTTLNTSDNEL